MPIIVEWHKKPIKMVTSVAKWCIISILIIAVNTLCEKEAAALLMGSFAHGVDAKGRIFIPAKWREDLGSSVIVTHGILGGSDARCLFGMSENGWREFAARFSSLPVTDIVGQAFRRMMFSNAADCEVDKQGRILIPNSLRDYAHLEKEAVLVGVDNRIEIWDSQAWQTHEQSMAGDYSEALMRLAQMGI